MKTWIVCLAMAGAVWMIYVLHTGSLALAMASNYPGLLATRLAHFRGIAPSETFVRVFNLWLILSSSIESVAIGFLVRAIAKMIQHRM